MMAQHGSAEHFSTVRPYKPLSKSSYYIHVIHHHVSAETGKQRREKEPAQLRFWDVRGWVGPPKDKLYSTLMWNEISDFL
jgi:hypothetical protein